MRAPFCPSNQDKELIEFFEKSHGENVGDVPRIYGSTDFGLKEFNVKSKKERIRRYRRYVYEASALNHPDKMQAKLIDAKVVAKERKKDFEISRISRFRHRTRFTLV